RLQEYLDQRIAELTASSAADGSKKEQLILAMGEQFQREVASLVDAKRGETEALAKDIGERIERQILANSQQQKSADEKRASEFDQAIKQQLGKLGEIDRFVAALGQRVDGLISSLAEVDRASSERGAALAGSLQSTVTALAQKGYADSQSLASGVE